MEISYHWLKEYVDFDYTPQQLKEKLTFIGLEVDAVKEIGQGLAAILVGEVLSVSPHPKSDTLFLSDVQIGRETLSVVVGTDNMEVGDKVPVAPPGSTLPGGQKIEEVAIRGCPSQGMLCSAHELGLADERDEILILPEHLVPGASLEQVLQLQDSILSVDLTPNYGHCLSMMGVAREVAALTGNRVRYETPHFSEAGPPAQHLAAVEIVDAHGCPRYSARIIQDIQLKDSPFWLKQRLQAAGVRPINNVVDITNYVMMELGQPLHAFDYDRIEEGKIIVRQAQLGESLTTLDGEERELVGGDLLICDARKPIALAGVMGGLNSEVTPETTHILLESAHFHPTTVRKTARRLGLPSEASHRFERGVDIGGTCLALDRAAQLLMELAGGRVSPGVIDAYPIPQKEKVISLRLDRVQKILGTPISSSLVRSILTSLSLTVHGEELLQVVVPTFRMDLQEEADLIEEVARHYGYDKIPQTLPQSMGQGRYTQAQKLEKKIRSLLEAMGLQEIITYSFISPHLLQDLNYRGEKKNWLYLKNPLNEDLSVMRTSLLPGLIHTLLLNQKRHQQEMALFELGKVFLQLREGSQEFLSLGALSTGGQDPWGLGAGSFYFLKGILESLFSRLQLELTFTVGEFPFLHPGRQSLLLMEKEEVGFLGELAPALVEKYALPQPCSCFELDLPSLLEKGGRQAVYEPVPRFPGVKRDLALVVDEEISAQEILEVIHQEGGELLQEVEIFDLYRGSQVGEGKKSLAYNLHFYSRERTLKDEQVDEIVGGILTVLEERLQAVVRR